MSTESGTRRRISPEREAQLYGAVLDLLREVGYDALTMDAVAARTHASKATLYRQWGGKPRLVVMALTSQRRTRPDEVNTGTLRGDIRALVLAEDEETMAERSALMRSLSPAVHHNPELLQAFRDLLINPSLAELDVLLERAVLRGEVAAGRPALRFVPHLLVGALVTEELVGDRLPTHAFLLAYADAVILPALGVPVPDGNG
ncbi:TetR family transcriptional regulator [Streptomyces sp. 3MP-14]|uniref:TetR family transcriptional regulator n=1 Tax=Streptomyces mimosae TaxID=2586635 RepID=A0A5N6AFF6_9ACTN|nr:MULTISPECIES: TetR/AcrR family transcriptional regulator [Streptomyces]KAB8166975.1 TetR family transcriptional regulator [Streptomyces mimosae]KAB8176916.1 TetR family transcriptional regulator [Streptomyces sp. 3MP-14]